MSRGWLLSTLAFCLIPLPQSNELVALWNDCYRSLGNLKEVRDMTLPSEDSIRLYDQSKWKFANDITIIERWPSDVDPDDIPPQDQRNEVDEVDEVEENHRSYTLALNRGMVLHQSLYKTTSGFIGLAPPSMRPGDQVFFLICDATVLSILRGEQTAAHYALIGEKYLHGFMNGEVCQKYFTDRLERLYLVWNERHFTDHCRQQRTFL